MPRRTLLPQVLPDRSGELFSSVLVADGSTRLVWLLTFVKGTALAKVRPHAPELLAEPLVMALRPRLFGAGEAAAVAEEVPQPFLLLYSRALGLLGVECILRTDVYKWHRRGSLRYRR